MDALEPMGGGGGGLARGARGSGCWPGEWRTTCELGRRIVRLRTCSVRRAVVPRTFVAARGPADRGGRALRVNMLDACKRDELMDSAGVRALLPESRSRDCAVSTMTLK